MSRARSGDGKHIADARPFRYNRQLELLTSSYAQTRAADLGPLRDALAGMRGRQAVYVGSGGALAVAALAADLHQVQTRMLAKAATPLDIIGSQPLFDAAVMLFTASGRHADAAATVEAARRGGVSLISVVTHRTRQELPPVLAAPDVEVISLPTSSPREGFLATNSVLAMATAVVAASGFRTPQNLPHLRNGVAGILRENTIILDGPGVGSVARDLETRLSETGLSSAQVTDYRNFAHGRHAGLARRLDQTTIVALVTPDLAGVANATLRALPPEAHVILLESQLAWPVCALDLLVGSMKLLAATAAESDLDPARPRVPPFGRKLYHLSSRAYLRGQANAVDRKVAAARAQDTPKLRRLYAEGLALWLDEVRETRFGAIVLDYDGTVCTTRGRFELPDVRIQGPLLELLEAGAVIGFASGRGSSLYRDLREWVPRPRWNQVELGLYNGGLHLNLTDELAPSDQRSPLIREVARRLRALPIGGLLRLEEREHQLGVEAVGDATVSTDVIAGAVLEVLAWAPAIALKVVASAHSVDVIPTESAKTATLERIRARVGQDVVAIGDQGQVGGNDFELLAATRFSLSVDRVSTDPTRCWNLDERGESGPALLARYLSAMRSTPGGLALRWKD